MGLGRQASLLRPSFISLRSSHVARPISPLCTAITSSGVFGLFLMKRSMASLQDNAGEDEDDYSSPPSGRFWHQQRPHVVYHVIQNTSLPVAVRADFLEETRRVLQGFLVQQRQRTPATPSPTPPFVHDGEQDATMALALLVVASTAEFTNLLSPPGRINKETRLALEQTARSLLDLSESDLSSSSLTSSAQLVRAWAISLVLGTLSVGTASSSSSSSFAAERAAASAISAAIQQQSWNTVVSLSSTVASMVTSLLTMGREEGLFNQLKSTTDLSVVPLDLHVVATWARSFGITAAHQDEPLSQATARIVRAVLHLEGTPNIDHADMEDRDDRSLNSNSSNEQRVAEKVCVAGAVTLAVQIGPWDDLPPSPLMEEAVLYDLWHGAEGICDSVLFWQQRSSSGIGKDASVSRLTILRTSVLALIDFAMESKRYRHADNFATKFFAYGGDERYVDARFYHACDTVSRLIRKSAFPIIERQVDRVDAAVKMVPSSRKSSVDRSAEIRAFTLAQLGEQGRIDVAKRLADLWGIAHTFDEDALRQAAEQRKQNYLQWEEVLPDQHVPELLSTPDELLSSFLNADFGNESVENVYGFDVEWGDEVSAGAALLQIATDEKVVLVDIPALSSTQQGADALERTVGRLFASPDTVIIGFACRQDMTRLRSSPCVRSQHWLGKSQGVVDVQPMVGKAEPTLKGLGLSKACEKFLGKPLDKSEQCSFWSARPLTKEQRVYAALDAWVCVILYQKILAATTESVRKDSTLPEQNIATADRRQSPLGGRSSRGFLGLCMVLFGLAFLPGLHAFQAQNMYKSPWTCRSTTQVLYESASSSPQTTKVDASKTTPQAPPPEPKQTLYDVLQGHPEMTRAQLKQQYVKLARQSHPDALRQSEGTTENDLDFTEIAAAWQILSDTKQRKRYDRSLQAEEFTRQVESWAGQAFNQAMPVAQAFGIALKKTAAGTVAGVAAAASAYSKAAQAEEIKSGARTDAVDSVEEESDVVILTPDIQEEAAPPKPFKASKESRGFQKTAAETRTAGSEAVDASPPESTQSSTTKQKQAQKKKKFVDGTSLVEKSEDLEERAVRQSQDAMAAKEELDQIMERRLRLALHTPHSGLTSSEANVLLEDLNQTVADRLSPLDRAMLRHTVLEEIDSLKRTEGLFVTAQKADTQAQDVYREAVQERVKNVEVLSQAIEEEDAARRAWVAAQERVQESRKNLVDTTRALAQAEIQAKKSDYELELQQMQLEKQAEKVRKALVQKEAQARQAKEQELLTQQQESGDPSDPEQETLLDEAWYYPDDDSPERWTALKELRADEQRLQEELARLGGVSTRLMSRANKLQQKAQNMEKEQ